MGLKIFERIFGKDGRVEYKPVPASEMCRMAEECRVRELALHACINLIASALSQCEFRTYAAGEEVFGENYWLWNFEPNVNENASAFLHKLVFKLYTENEVLLIPTIRKTGKETHSAFVVADSYQKSKLTPARQMEYSEVCVGDFKYSKTFREDEVIHLVLHGANMKPVLDSVNQSYEKLISAGMKNYLFSNGQHWKVHVEQMAAGADGWAESFQEMMTAQVKPFLEASSAVLPEMDGYSYENVDKSMEDGRDASGIQDLVKESFTLTATGMNIPAVLILGDVEATGDAKHRFWTDVIDPLAKQLTQEINRKHYGAEAYLAGNYLKVDTSTIDHFDLFANAANVSKLIGSGFSYNDLCRAAGFPQIDADWANEHFITKNFETAAKLLKGETE